MSRFNYKHVSPTPKVVQCYYAYLKWLEDVVIPEERCPSVETPAPYEHCANLPVCDDLAMDFCFSYCPHGYTLCTCPNAITLPDWLVKNQKRLCKHFFS